MQPISVYLVTTEHREDMHLSNYVHQNWG